MTFKLICTYCNYSFEVAAYSPHSLSDRKCMKCGDRHLRIRELNETRIDTYAGAPPFAPKHEDTDYGF